MATSKKNSARAAKILKDGRRNKPIAASDSTQAPVRSGARKMAKAARSGRWTVRNPGVTASPARVTPPTVRPPMPPAPHGRVDASDERPLAESVDEETIARLLAEAEKGIPAEKLRRRGRPAIGDEAARPFSIRLPDDLIALADERSRIDSVSRGETIRRALIEYLTK